MLIDKRHSELVWDRLARGVFHVARLRPVAINGVSVAVLCARPKREWYPEVYLQSGLSFALWPRLAAYRYRWVIVPLENAMWRGRWDLRSRDVCDWISWAAHMEYVVTFSTFLSGASEPHQAHAQTFPLRQNGTCLSALSKVGVVPLVRFGDMPHFEAIEIDRLAGYPANGLRLRGDGSHAGREQVARKAFELALTYNHLTAFNIVVVPEESGEPSLYYFPRPKLGPAIVGKLRWQWAALEMNGLVQARTPAQARRITASRISEMFARMSLSDTEFDEFLGLLDAF